MHKGFRAALEDVWKTLHTHYKKHGVGKQLLVTGHSLGAALATLYSDRIADMNSACYTFGSPRVGCSLFAQLFNERINNSFRYVNDNDPVPCVPSSLTYEHVKGLKWLNEDVVKNEIQVWRFWRFIKNTFLN